MSGAWKASARWNWDRLRAAERDLAVARQENERLTETLRKLADIHHRTLTSSRLHDPERIDSFHDCSCKTCSEASAVLGGEEPACTEAGRRG